MTIIITALILGLTSSLHCIGMCGPIAMAIPIDRSSQSKVIFGILTYNLGRILVYGLLGLIIGSIGFSLQTFGILQWISILSGIGLIIFAWRKYLSKLNFHFLPSLQFNGMINKLFGKIVRSNSKFKLLFLGAINGLLPCGMVYIALLNALLAGTLVGSSMAMISFGLGTIPAMFAVSYTFNKITGKTRLALNRIVPYAMTVVGLMIVLRGLNLGIPYLSPEIKISKTDNVECTSEQGEEVTMSCCHK